MKNSLLARALRIALLAAVLVATTAAAPTRTPATLADAGPDAVLTQILADIDLGDAGAALARTDRLLAQYPNFRLAHLIRGDLLLARSQPLQGFGGDAMPIERLSELRQEAQARLAGYRMRPMRDSVPRALMQLSPSQHYAVVVDTQHSRLYLYRNDSGTPRLAADYYISQGKAGSDKLRTGDNKTPLGVYFVTSWIPGEKLPPYYGVGAFPLNYPNELDRQQGRSGSGIWLHGVPSDTFARAPLASEGCVVLSNADLMALSPYFELGVTPVVISNQVQWISPRQRDDERQTLAARLEAWRQDASRGDAERLRDYYSERFPAGSGAALTVRDPATTDDAGIQPLRLSGVSMLRGQSQDDVVLVSFEQSSGPTAATVHKRQYWVREAGQWKIILEGTV
ncbi:MAG: L,D-transpeptidase family protein [Rhodocyclaceae bacterium]